MQMFHFEQASLIGHAYILSSPSREEALRSASLLASAAVCLEEREVPCGICRGCRKVQSGVHPDVIHIRREADTKGNLRRELTVSQIREVALDAPLRPNEAERKVYIVDEAELLNLNAQNAALKLLEEPPSSVIFILCTTNPDQLLETIRSRCALVNVSAAEDEGDEESEKLAEGYLAAVSSGKPEKLYRWIAKNELSKLDATSAFLDAALRRLADMLCGRTESGALDPVQSMHLYRLLERCSDYLRVNVNAKHVFSLLELESMQSESTLKHQ